MEATSASLLTFGIATLLVSWVLLLIQSWKEAGQAILLALIGVILIWMA